jgi:succinyl-CoA synthetase beta subunit
MRLLEYQGKELFKKVGIPISEGKVASTPDEVEAIAQDFGGEVVVKAQVLAGGRAKAGGIKLASTPAQARECATTILGMEIKGERVSHVLVTKSKRIKKELYLGITIDRSARKPVVIFSTEGGVEIEEVAREKPEAIFRFYVNPLEGPRPYQIRNVLFKAKFKSWELYDIFEKLYQAFVKYQATLVEINPLAVTDDGLVAIDSKFIIDDDASLKLPWEERLTDQEREAKQSGLQYVKLDGNIGIIGNGAGLVMATIDVIKLKGGKPANFLDIGGGASAEQMQKAIKIVQKGARGIFINIFGGLTRCDEVARGILKARDELKIGVPMVVRLVGTNESEGRKILEKGGISAIADLEEGAEKITKEVR